MSRYTIETWETDRGWSARARNWHIEAEGGETEDEAANAAIGSVYAMLGHRVCPPREVTFDVRRRCSPATDGGTTDE